MQYLKLTAFIVLPKNKILPLIIFKAAGKISGSSHLVLCASLYVRWRCLAGKQSTRLIHSFYYQSFTAFRAYAVCKIKIVFDRQNMKASAFCL